MLDFGLSRDDFFTGSRPVRSIRAGGRRWLSRGSAHVLSEDHMKNSSPDISPPGLLVSGLGLRGAGFDVPCYTLPGFRAGRVSGRASGGCRPIGGQVDNR